MQTLLDQSALAADRSCPLTVCRCPRCGLVQLAEDPDAGRVYSADYLYSVNFSQHAQEYQRALAARWARDHHLAGLRVLEIGGGDGLFASLLESHGCHVTLVEPAPRACQAARERGLRCVIEGYLTAETFPEARFDAVVARHVLEHIPQPVDFLALLRAQLVPGGRLFIEVPNLDGTVAQGRHQDFYAEHLSYFQPRSLAAAVSEAGLEVLEFFTIENGDYLVGVTRVPARSLDELIADTEQFIGQFRAMARDSRAQGRRL
ncbi:MAG TPA: class I SAM-dependent methyltransferase, partial [Isosphaeraceae bacterium]|nr:class I SAM-dependent methyltransferase [Isosphaeraceae bacterium]